MGIPQLSHAAVVVIGSSSWVNPGVLVRGGLADQGTEAGYEVLDLAGRQPGHGAGQHLDAQYLPVAAKGLVSLRGQPDQRPPPVGGVVLLSAGWLRQVRQVTSVDR
jgi:hypothetical protein